MSGFCLCIPTLSKPGKVSYEWVWGYNNLPRQVNLLEGFRANLGLGDLTVNDNEVGEVEMLGGKGGIIEREGRGGIVVAIVVGLVVGMVELMFISACWKFKVADDDDDDIVGVEVVVVYKWLLLNDVAGLAEEEEEEAIFTSLSLLSLEVLILTFTHTHKYTNKQTNKQAEKEFHEQHQIQIDRCINKYKL
jgi:heme/copper-type cytochrome/quinol oxidase subunit 2